MSKAQRQKGARGELAVAKELERLTGIHTERDLSQARDGGSDLVGLPGYTIEVKTHRGFAVTKHLEQAAAVSSQNVPMVVLNPDRKKMMVLMYLDDFAPLLLLSRT